MYRKSDEILKRKTGIILSHLYLIFSFVILDAWLRVMTRWIGAYSIYEPAPNLFTFTWAVMLTALLTMISSQKVGRLVYAVVYYVCMAYSVVQYGAYLVLGRFLFISDFFYASEGAVYASWVLDLLTPVFLLQVILLVSVGIVGVVLYPVKVQPVRKSVFLGFRLAIIVACIIAVGFIPGLYGSMIKQSEWSDSADPAYEYQRFSNANFDMELTGMYQYFVRDLQVQLSRGENKKENHAMIDCFFEMADKHSDNAMSGIFQEKNVIVVMMETMDDWLITAEDTPTLHHMISSGISFSNFYTPQYSNGYTFNTEFAFNTSVYPYTNGNVAYSLARNKFDCSLPAQFFRAGYAVNSFHEGNPIYYNREVMHKAWGYEAYHSYQNYETEISLCDDRFLTKCDELFEDLTGNAPFFSFVITYSPHLPYTDDDETAQIALDAHPEYRLPEDREVAILRAKARLTDDMFAALLARLEENGILDDTVIVGFGDHYAYGLSDKEQLRQLSEDAGSCILERTPAFIYCAGSDLCMEVDKVMQITDLAPTILNLFGLDVPTAIMGRDIFDENYQGHVIFANGSWLTGSAYVKHGVIQWNNGMTEEEIAEMNAYVQRVYQVNDAILDSDYYAG